MTRRQWPCSGGLAGSRRLFNVCADLAAKAGGESLPVSELEVAIAAALE